MPEESQSEKDLPNWDSLYKSQKVETMPWYNKIRLGRGIGEKKNYQR